VPRLNQEEEAYILSQKNEDDRNCVRHSYEDKLLADWQQRRLNTKATRKMPKFRRKKTTYLLKICELAL